MADDGVIKSISRVEDEAGKIVLQAIVHFYDGNSPALSFKTVWESVPVKIVEAGAHSSGGRDG